MFCVHCGKNNEEDVELCAYCGKPMNDHTQMLEVLDGPVATGSPLEASEHETGNLQALKPEQPFCVHCGKPNDVSAAICVYCGKPLNDHTQMLEIMDTPIQQESDTTQSELPQAFCVHCGRANDPSEDLCAFCGKPLNDHTQLLEVLDTPVGGGESADNDGQIAGDTSAADDDTPRFCWYCGQPLPAGVSFCGICGAPVDAADLGQSGVVGSVPAGVVGGASTVAPAVVVPSAVPTAGAPGSNMTGAQPAPDNTRIVAIAVIVVAVAVICIVAAVAAIYLLN